jgi:hypothetical protein
MNPLAIIEIGAKLLDKIIPDKDAREKAQFELLKASQDQDFQLALGQIQTNTEEAKHSNLFVSGWRPFIGWVCGFGLTYNFLIYPLLLWIISINGATIKPPPLFADNLMELVLGMLGLGTLRSFEKWKGVTK